MSRAFGRRSSARLPLDLGLVACGSALLAAVIFLSASFSQGAADTLTGEMLTRNTVRLSLAWYAAALCLMMRLAPADWLAASNLGRLARWFWTWGVVCFLVHLAMAFRYYHHWSHDDAFEHTRQVSGSGEGIYASYLFTLLWLADAIWWWCGPASYAARSPRIDRTLHAFMLFIVFNGMVVFENGPIRWAGLVMFTVLPAVWLLSRARQVAIYMSQSGTALTQRRTWPQSLPFYYGWINVVVAAVAMTATLPGRTHGLGLVTEPLSSDLNIDQVLFARINLFGSLAGAAFCIPVGWLIDRCGVRSVLAAVTAALGLSVVGMSAVTGPASLLLGLVLVRGFGQSALSVVAIAAIGKWFNRRLGTAMGVFAVLLTFGFIGSVLAMGAAVGQCGWRTAWQDLGLIVLTLSPLFWLLARSTPEACGLPADEPPGTLPVLRSPESKTGLSPSSQAPEPTAHDFTFRQALGTPAFWILVLGSSAFNLVWSGVTLFNESMLAERGLGQEFAVRIMAILTGVGLLANLVGGALATRARVLKLLAVGLIFLAGGLAVLPTIGGPAGAQLYATAIGLSGGIVTVVFFAAWGHLFGRAQLGRIAAQLATVLASALGPVVMAESRALTGSYRPMFFVLAGLAGLLALAALLTPPPRLSKG